VQSASNAATPDNHNACVEGESTAAAEVPGISQPSEGGNAVGSTGGAQTTPEAEQDVPAGVLEQSPGEPASPVEDDGTLVTGENTHVPGGNEGATTELLEGGGLLEEGYVSGSDTSASVPHDPPSTSSPPDCHLICVQHRGTMTWYVSTYRMLSDKGAEPCMYVHQLDEQAMLIPRVFKFRLETLQIHAANPNAVNC